MDIYRTAIFDTEEQARTFSAVVQTLCNALPGKVEIRPVLLKSGAYPGKWGVTLMVEPPADQLVGVMVVDTVEAAPVGE